MKNQLKLISVGVALFIVSLSFTKAVKSEVVGNYGDSIIQLSLNDDNTFSHYSSFDANNKIEANGTWLLEKGKIVLQSKIENNNLPKEWKLKNEGQTIKSRNGMIFFTLQKAE
jgi:hypothetical protein